MRHTDFDLSISAIVIPASCSLVPGLLSRFLSLRKHGEGIQTEQDIIHFRSVKGGAVLLMYYFLLLSW